MGQTTKRQGSNKYKERANLDNKETNYEEVHVWSGYCYRSVNCLSSHLLAQKIKNALHTIHCIFQKQNRKISVWSWFVPQSWGKSMSLAKDCFESNPPLICVNLTPKLPMCFSPKIRWIQRKCQINLFSCIFELNSKNPI